MYTTYSNKNKERTKILSRVAFSVALIAGLVMTVFLVMLDVRSKVRVQQERDDRGFTIVEDYSCIETEAEGTPVGFRKYYTLYPDDTIKKDTYLAFYTVHQYVKVWLDGEMVYCLEPSGEENLSKTVGSNWVLIPLYREDAGKEISVEITPVYEGFRNREVEFLLGSRLAIYKDRLKKDLPQLILSVVAIFVGLVFVCVAGYNRICRHRGKGMVALGLFSVMMGIWRLTDTRFTPFVFPNHPVLMFYLSVSMLMLGMIPLMKWLEEYFTEKTKKIFDIYCIVSAVVCLIQLICQLAKIADIRETLSITHIMIGAGVVIAVAAVVYERIKYPDNVRVKVGSKLPYICVAGVMADVGAFYVKGNSSGLLFSLSAFLLCIVILGISTLFHYSEEELLALLIDRGETGITKADAIACLWAGYSSDNIYWTTMSRLKGMLEEAGISDILITNGQTKCINTELVECDLYQMLDGDATVISRYQGEYLQRFPWARDRRTQLDNIKSMN